MNDETNIDEKRDLVFAMTLEAPRENVWRCWTEPALLKQWFTPKPWTTPHAELDVRPGGKCLVVMRSPEGEEHPNPGIYLEIDPGRKLVTTDAYSEDWQPSDKAFMTLIVTLEDSDSGGTDYRAVVRHWSEEDRAAHEKMGFHDGWAMAARQLEEVAKSL